MFATTTHFYPTLTFAGKAGAYQSGASLLQDSTVMVGSKPCPQILDESGGKWKWQTL